jgi:hypothetical protein
VLKRRRSISGFKGFVVPGQRLTALGAQSSERSPSIEPIKVAKGELGRFRKLSDFQLDCQ